MLDLADQLDWVVYGDNADVLPKLPDASFPLIYIDPPFNTGRAQRRTPISVVRDETGDRTGFGGNRYASQPQRASSFADSFDDYMNFVGERVAHAHRLLTPQGTMYFHIDYREAHYCKVLLDGIFGRDCFLNEIIWAYDYGGRSKRRWAAKHDTILVYTRDPHNWYFDQDAVERIPYMAPGLVTPEKAARGKLPTDVWWHTIVPTRSAERTGYATQKPEGILRRVLCASSRPGDRVLDFFAGSGTTGAVAQQLDRRFVLIDNNSEAIRVMQQRLAAADTRWVDSRGRLCVHRADGGA
ncbi:DNA-methyltransferase [Candidatus Poriferisodalis sp.]|uniref:DNA-methyltransferase n=1 Tax=Candidatus Poriferisodalis sp. TaxID=3101277 RepID=UPI003B01BF37